MWTFLGILVVAAACMIAGWRLTAESYRTRLSNMVTLEHNLRKAQKDQRLSPNTLFEAEKHLQSAKDEFLQLSPHIEFVDRSIELGTACLTADATTRAGAVPPVPNPPSPAPSSPRAQR